MTTRRDFLKEILAGITVVGFVPSVLVSCSDDPSSVSEHGTVTIDVSSLDAEGKAVRSTLPDPNKTPIMVVRRPSNTYVTLQLICTHQGCKGDSLLQSGQILECQCHGSRYDLDGHVTQGPATRNLATYVTSFDSAKSQVTVTY